MLSAGLVNLYWSSVQDRFELEKRRAKAEVKIKQLENDKEEEVAKNKKDMKLEIVMMRKRSVMKEKQVEEEAKMQEEVEEAGEE